MIRSSTNGLTDLQQRELTWNCWNMSGLDDSGSLVLDEECLAVNALLDEIDHVPEWAISVRKAMPQYGFERCAHRWLDGLDDVMRMIGAEQCWPSSAGHCGDVPGRVAAGAERRAAAVQAWITGDPLPNDPRAAWLGERTPKKLAAASCFVELVNAFFFEPRPNHKAMALALAHTWRSLIGENLLLAVLFQGEGFDSLLQNRCGFMILHRLDLYIRLIGGDMSRADDRHGVCNDQLRFDDTDDSERSTVTRGYLWGLYAALKGHDADWLRAHTPDCAGAARYALQRVGEATDPVHRWLIASLLKATKVWLLVGKRAGDAPATPQALPDLLTAIR